MGEKRSKKKLDLNYIFSGISTTEKLYCYSSPLPEDTIMKIISQQKKERMSIGIVGKTISGRKIEVFYRPGYGNSWNPKFIGVVSSTIDTTTIRGTFRLPAIVTIFPWIWRGIVCWSVFIMINVFVFFSQNTEVSPVVLLILIGMIIFSFVLEFELRRLGESCQSEVLKFFEDELLASPIEI